MVPDYQFIEVVTTWSRDLGRWDLLDVIWRDHLDDSRLTRHPGVVAVLRSLPDGARRRYPALTWGMALAEAQASEHPHRVALRRVIRDGVVLHSTWYGNEDLDAIVSAGSIWMLCQRMLPADARSRSPQSPSATGPALEEVIAEHAERGITPSEWARTTFTVVAAHNALGQGELARATSLGGLATILEGAGPQLDVVARGVVQLSLALGGTLPLNLGGHSPGPAPDEAGNWGLVAQAGMIMVRLADGLRALDRLDRGGCERALRLVRPEEAWVASVGTIHAYLEAVYRALWVSPEQALAGLDAVRATYAGRTPEALDPLGMRLLARARSFILVRLGAADAAMTAAADLPEDYGRVALARTHLLIGDTDEAQRVANEGLLDPRTWLHDRLHLRMLRSAAVLMDPLAGACEQASAVRALVEAAEEQTLLPLALPQNARTVILERVRAHAADDDPEVLLTMESRLHDLVDVAESDASRIQLTNREQVLLPLLASSEPVPEIAKHLHLSPNTVRKQVVGLRAKFQAGNRAELIRNARQAGHLH